MVRVGSSGVMLSWAPALRTTPEIWRSSAAMTMSWPLASTLPASVCAPLRLSTLV